MYQWLQDGQKNFLKLIFAAKHFFKWIKNGEKKPIWAKIVQKWQFITFEILIVDVSDENDFKLDRIVRNF